MIHNDDLRERVIALIDDYEDRRVDHIASDVIDVIHADLAARALSDEVVDAVRYARNGTAIWNFDEMMVVEGEEGSDEEIVAALLRALGITTEAE